MLDDLEFRRVADAAIKALKQHLIAREDEAEAGFEVEEQGGALTVLFEPHRSRFVVMPNAPMRQLWVSALSTSFKLDWDPAQQMFILPRTGEPLIPLLNRLIDEHTQ